MKLVTLLKRLDLMSLTMMIKKFNGKQKKRFLILQKIMKV